MPVIYICYMLVCTKENCIQKDKFQKLYIGETERTLKDRISEHIGYINTKKYTEAAGEHFNSQGHSKLDMKVRKSEKIRPIV